MPSKNRRKILRAPGFDYSSPGAYFVTMVTFQREILFGEISENKLHMNEAGNTVETVWKTLPERYPSVTLDAFVVMPNHFHGILIFDNSSVGEIHELPYGKMKTKKNSVYTVAVCCCQR